MHSVLVYVGSFNHPTPVVKKLKEWAIKTLLIYWVKSINWIIDVLMNN